MRLQLVEAAELDVRETEGAVDFGGGDEDGDQVLLVVQVPLHVDLEVDFVVLDELVAVVEDEQEAVLLAVLLQFHFLLFQFLRDVEVFCDLSLLEMVYLLIDLAQVLRLLQVNQEDARRVKVPVPQIPNNLRHQLGLANALHAMQVDASLPGQVGVVLGLGFAVLLLLALAEFGVAGGLHGVQEVREQVDELGEGAVLSNNKVLIAILILLGIADDVGRRAQIRDVNRLPVLQVVLGDARVEERLVGGERGRRFAFEVDGDVG